MRKEKGWENKREKKEDLLILLLLAVPYIINYTTKVNTTVEPRSKGPTSIGIPPKTDPFNFITKKILVP